MLKVHIVDRCPYCNGQAYLPAGEDSNWKGETYTRYAPCQMCVEGLACSRRTFKSMA